MPERPVALPPKAVGGTAVTDAHSSPASPWGPLCVLVIEDATEIANLMDDIVRDLGYAVSGLASTIAAARHELAKRNFDAVLLDMGLDGLYSPEIADALLEMGVPFAFVTGYDEPFEARHASVPLLSKPFKSEQLRVLLENLIGPSRRGDEMARRGLTHPHAPAPDFRKAESVR
jgi:DNA-binding NtrC family response regulator